MSEYTYANSSEVTYWEPFLPKSGVHCLHGQHYLYGQHCVYGRHVGMVTRRHADNDLHYHIKVTLK